MLRQNPDRQKKRFSKTTVFVFGEGSAEKAFLDHLKGCYLEREGNVAVKIVAGRGSAPVSIVRDAIRISGGYDRVVVVIDNDHSEEEMSAARSEAVSNRIELVEHTPCLEAVLLAILEPGKSYVEKTADWCKHEFETKHMDRTKRTEKKEYEKIFPKNVLDKAVGKNTELKKLIDIVSGK